MSRGGERGLGDSRGSRVAGEKLLIKLKSSKTQIQRKTQKSQMSTKSRWKSSSSHTQASISELLSSLQPMDWVTRGKPQSMKRV